jgi:N-methylhydantoinase A
VVIVPKNAGALSALGMLLSDTIKDHSHTVLRSGDDISMSEVVRLFQPLLARGFRDLKKEGFSREKMQFLKSLDVRYSGQSYELTVPFTAGLRTAFNRLHLKQYGYADEKRPVEIVNLRVQAIGRTQKPRLAEIGRGGKKADAARIDRRAMRFEGKIYKADVYAREALAAGNIIIGPGLILDYESTAVVPPNFLCRVDKYGNLIITARRY